MNFKTNSARRILRWATGGAASFLTAASAFGQTSLTQSVPIIINDATQRPTGPNTFVSDTAAATPFPSSLVTSNLLGTIERVTVTLNGVTHNYPDDVNVALKYGTKAVQLMSDVGDRFALNGVNLSFADAATASLPDSSVISDGTYKPTDVVDLVGDISGTDLYPGGPVAPFETLLSAFNGGNPNGSWDLFVADDQYLSSGSIRSWTLNVFTTPLLSVTNTVIPATEDTVVNVPLKLQDSDTPLSAMTFKVTSSDTTKVPNDLLVTGDGENRVLVIQPKANANGTVTVTVVAKDGVGESIPVVLTVNITAVNDAPLITLSTNSVNTVVGKSAALIAVVNDVDSVLSNLTITATSSNTNVVESAGLVVTDGTNTTSRTLTINPRGAASGTATLTISIVDTGSAGVLGTNTVSLDVTVAPVAQAVFATSSGANSGNITINDNANASPFPATLTIPTNFIGNIGRLEVTLADVTHPNPADLAVFLTGPTGKIVVLLGNAAGLNALNRSRIDFSTTAASAIPAGTAIINGAYLPTGSSSLTAGGITSNDVLSGFAGTDPRGVWSLSVVDTTAGSAGNIAGGFVLRIFSAPSLNSGNAIAAVTTAEDTAKTITVPVADFDGSVTNVTASFGDPTLAKVTATFTNGIATVVITPELNQSGANNVTLTATDNNNFSTSSIIGLTVTPVNDAPSINPVAKQIVRVGGFFEVPFTIGDVDTALSLLTVTASSSNGKLVPNTGIVLSGTGANRTAAIFPK
ncbi:MAG: proprotein convertase P-domain-containing protein, partial [Verrucomicrobiota bacterium]